MQTWMRNAIKRNAKANTAMAQAFCSAAAVEWMPNGKRPKNKREPYKPSRAEVCICMMQRHGTRGHLY